jgi:hypothetical protein
LNFRLLNGKDLIRIFPRVTEVHTVRIPQEVLEKFVWIFLPNNDAGSLNDIATVLNKLTTLRRKLVLIYGRLFKNITQGRVNLVVGRITPLAESLNDAIKSELTGGEWVGKRISGRDMNDSTFLSTSATNSCLLTGAATAFLGGCSVVSLAAVGRDMLDEMWEENNRPMVIIYATTLRETTSLCGVHHLAFHKVMSLQLVAEATRVHACHVNTTPSGVTLHSDAWPWDWQFVPH